MDISIILILAFVILLCVMVYRAQVKKDLDKDSLYTIEVEGYSPIYNLEQQVLDILIRSAKEAKLPYTVTRQPVQVMK